MPVAHRLRNDKLRFLSTNARSLGNKINELEVIMASENIDVVAVTETWFNGSNDWDITIPGFSLYRKDRDGKKVEGWPCM